MDPDGNDPDPIVLSCSLYALNLCYKRSGVEIAKATDLPISNSWRNYTNKSTTPLVKEGQYEISGSKLGINPYALVLTYGCDMNGR